jgi:Cu/Ag efflux pump CusA
MGDQIVDVNSAELWVTIDPKANYHATAHAIKTTVEGYPGLSYTVQTYLREKSGDVIPEPEDKVVVRVFGSKYAELDTTAKNIDSAISGIEGIEKTRVKTPIQQAALETEVDLVKAQKHGLKPGDVRRAAACLLSGVQVGALYEDQRIFDVVVWSTPENRHSISNINNLMIDAPGGARVPLGDVANISIKPAASVIRHDSVKRYVDIVADVYGRDLGAVAADISSTLKGMSFPLEYHATILGDYVEPKSARNHFVVLGIVAAIGIFFLLEAAFGSWRLAAMTFLTVPAALIGGLVAALATGGTVLSLGSLTGLLAVLGFALCSSITLIRHFQRSSTITAGESVANGAVGPNLVARGASERVGPILAATLATAAALAPVFFLGDVPGFEIARPMVIVTLGGLATSILFVLFAVPALFLLCGPGRVSDLETL